MNTPRQVVTVIFLLLATTAASAAPDPACGRRARLEQILNLEPRAPDATQALEDPVNRLYDIIESWAMAVAVGDYDAAEQLGPVIRPQLAALYDEVDTSVGEFAPDAVYARLVVGGALARVSLVSHAFVDAARYGAGARSDARWLEAHDPGSGRADFFFGLYELYTGIAPFWLRAAGVLAGVHGDPARGRLLLERVVRDNGAFAPEAARVLLEEVPASHRPTCRYLSLAVDLARLYPRNGRFQWYVDREFARCEDLAEYPALDAPRLKGGCGAAADLAQANGAPGGWPPYSP